MREHRLVGFEDLHVGIGIAVFGLGDGAQGVALLHRDESGRRHGRRADADLILYLGHTFDITQGQEDLLLLFLGRHLATGDHLVALDRQLDGRVAQAHLGHMLLQRLGGLGLLADQRFPQLHTCFFDKVEDAHDSSSRSIGMAHSAPGKCKSRRPCQLNRPTATTG
ncbi:hypothetical protein D3C76_1256460 [compost metagenome]